jgi:glutaminase
MTANPGTADLDAVLGDILAAARASTDRGRVADYIPELAGVDPGQFGLSVALADGSQHSVGDADVPFSIQSVSKVFALAIALGRLGDRLWARVGREPSGLAFNSILQLEHEEGIPRNPFINAGAIVVTDAALAGHAPREYLGELLRFIRAAAEDDDIHINDAVARSETETGHRNFALAHYMRAHGNLDNPPELTLGAYFHQCAVEMSCAQLARAGRFLMGAPGMPRLVSADRVRRINALMLTCGHYDGSGDFAFRVGLPGKSGVGGGILVIAPGRASVAVWSPGLNAQGNSKLGTEAVETLARRMGWSVFG